MERAPLERRGARDSVLTILGKRYRRLDCPGDGRCFFHAVARALNASRPAEGHTAYDVYERTRAHDPSVRPTWADDRDVLKTAAALSLNVWMWEGVNACWVQYGDEAHRKIWLHNSANVHYDALLPLDAEPP